MHRCHRHNFAYTICYIYNLVVNIALLSSFITGFVTCVALMEQYIILEHFISTLCLVEFVLLNL